MVGLKTIVAVFAALLGLLSSNAMADMPLDRMEGAIGIAKVIYNADKCGYKIDQSALERYLSAQKMDDPETLAFISSVQSTEELNEKGPSASMCTLSRATAKKAGFLD